MGRRFLCRLSAARPALPGLQEFFTQSADINSAILLAIFSSAGGPLRDFRGEAASVAASCSNGVSESSQGCC